MPPPPMNRRSSSGAFPDSNKHTPPHGGIVFSDNGLMLKGPEGGVLLPGQKFALRIITGMVHSRQLIGRWSLRGALVFHAMGSGKTVVVHALLNYLAGLVRNNKSAACRVVLMWQHEDSMRDNERKIRSNEYNVFAAPVRVGPNEPIHKNLMFHPEDDIFSDERFTVAEAKAADKIITQIFDDVGDNIWDKVDRAWAGAETWT
jgi:hypothetical protein